VNEGLSVECKHIWDSDVAPHITSELSKSKFVCGDQFTAADIMVGWSLYTAHLLGWLSSHPTLQQYLSRLSKRPAFQRTFPDVDF